MPRGPVEGRGEGGVPASGWYAGLLSISDTTGHSRTQPDYSRTHRTRPDTPDTTGHNRTVFPDTSGQGHTWCCPKRAGQHRTQNGQTGQYSGQYSGQLRTAHRTAHRTLTGHPPDTTGHTGQPDTHGSDAAHALHAPPTTRPPTPLLGPRHTPQIGSLPVSYHARQPHARASE